MNGISEVRSACSRVFCSRMDAQFISFLLICCMVAAPLGAACLLYRGQQVPVLHPQPRVFHAGITPLASRRAEPGAVLAPGHWLHHHHGVLQRAYEAGADVTPYQGDASSLVGDKDGARLAGHADAHRPVLVAFPGLVMGLDFSSNEEGDLLAAPEAGLAGRSWAGHSMSVLVAV